MPRWSSPSTPMEKARARSDPDATCRPTALTDVPCDDRAPARSVSWRCPTGRAQRGCRQTIPGRSNCPAASALTATVVTVGRMPAEETGRRCGTWCEDAAGCEPSSRQTQRRRHGPWNREGWEAAPVSSTARKWWHRCWTRESGGSSCEGRSGHPDTLRRPTYRQIARVRATAAEVGHLPRYWNRVAPRLPDGAAPNARVPEARQPVAEATPKRQSCVPRQAAKGQRAASIVGICDVPGVSLSASPPWLPRPHIRSKNQIPC